MEGRVNTHVLEVLQELLVKATQIRYQRISYVFIILLENGVEWSLHKWRYIINIIRKAREAGFKDISPDKTLGPYKLNMRNMKLLSLFLF